MIWGANPSASAPHAHEHWLHEVTGTKIVVDPVRTGTAASADLHLQPFPGSDAALAFALLHVMRREGLLDRDFIRHYTVGWDELEPLLEGCTPAWGWISRRWRPGAASRSRPSRWSSSRT